MASPGRRRTWLYSCALAMLPAGTIAQSAPEPEFLEFLSTWSDETGEVLDPAMFDDDPPPAGKPDEEVPDARD